MTPFLSTFSTLNVWNVYFWIWKCSKVIFMWSPLWSILVCKVFVQKLPICTAHHTFLESRQSEVTKNLYYVLSTHQGQICIFLRLQLIVYERNTLKNKKQYRKYMFFYNKKLYKKMSLKNPKNLRKSPASNDWGAVFKISYFSWFFYLKVTKLSKF